MYSPGAPGMQGSQASKPNLPPRRLELPKRAQDPRSSSTQSLHPPDNESGEGKRRLFLIYVHGFMGDETSFAQFPAHVHHNLAQSLQESHVVHTKIYPPYKTRHKVEEVREIFSNW